jgi:hypothetical protein
MHSTWSSRSQKIKRAMAMARSLGGRTPHTGCARLKAIAGKYTKYRKNGVPDSAHEHAGKRILVVQVSFSSIQASS